MTTTNLVAAQSALDVAIKYLMENNMTIKDGHNGGTGEVTLSGVAIHQSGTRFEIVALFDAPYFSINPIRFSTKGPLTLNSWSCGGTFYVEGELANDVATYNESLTFGGGIIEYWTSDMEGSLSAKPGNGLVSKEV